MRLFPNPSSKQYKHQWLFKNWDTENTHHETSTHNLKQTLN